MALHKPAGVTSTTRDRHADTTVLDLVPTALVPDGTRLYPVGRLDQDSEGLLLLTNDGEWAERVLHPRFGVEREYAVAVRTPLIGEQARALNAGIRLDEGLARSPDRFGHAPSVEIRELAATLDPPPDPTLVWYLATLAQGWKRQLRRMFGAVDAPIAPPRARPDRIGAARRPAIRSIAEPQDTGDRGPRRRVASTGAQHAPAAASASPNGTLPAARRPDGNRDRPGARRRGRRDPGDTSGLGPHRGRPTPTPGAAASPLRARAPTPLQARRLRPARSPPATPASCRPPCPRPSRRTRPAVSTSSAALVFASYLLQRDPNGIVARDQTKGSWAVGLWFVAAGTAEARLLAATEGRHGPPLAIAPHGDVVAAGGSQHRASDEQA